LFLFVSTSKVIIFLFWTFRKVKITLLFHSGNTCFSFCDGPVFETLFIYQRNKDHCVFRYWGNEKVIGFTIINLFSRKTLFRDVNMFQDFRIASPINWKMKNRLYNIVMRYFFQHFNKRPLKFEIMNNIKK